MNLCSKNDASAKKKKTDEPTEDVVPEEDEVHVIKSYRRCKLAYMVEIVNNLLCWVCFFIAEGGGSRGRGEGRGDTC